MLILSCMRFNGVSFKQEIYLAELEQMVAHLKVLGLKYSAESKIAYRVSLHWVITALHVS